MKIAITGGIGSGKSTVSKFIEERGYFVCSCDEIYSNLLQNNEFLERLADAFGKKIIVGGELDRKKLSAIVFGDADARKKLDAIAHPAIMREAFLQMSGKEIAFCEVPLLFENGYEKYFDRVIVVLRNREERIRQIRQRDGLSEEAAISRVNSQFCYDNSDFAKYYVIHNNGNLSNLSQKTSEILAEMLL